jgi:lanosterol synthase
MTVRRRGDVKHANGSVNGTTNDTVKHGHSVDLKTDHLRWRMKNVDGRQTWHYLELDKELKAWPMTSADKYYLGMDTVRPLLHKVLTVIFSDDTTRALKPFPKP